MAFATIQMTQGAVVGGSGESVLGFDTTTAITLTDDGGAGANSYLWECISFPGPDASAPVITDSSSQVATITPPGGGLTDGMFIIRLTRDDPIDGISTDVRFFAVENNDGHSLPSSRVNRNMSNVGGSVAAQDAGWFGSEAGSTNVFLDAFLRLRKAREGRYLGRTNLTSHVSGSTVTVSYTYGTDDPFQQVTMNAGGSGNFQADLSGTDAEDGATFRFRVVYANASTGNFIVRDSASSPILTLTAPPAPTVTYEIICRYDGTEWRIVSVSLVDVLALRTEQEFVGVAGVFDNSTDTFQRVGTMRIDPNLFPANAQATFEASFETTDAGNAAEVRLFNVTDTAVVAGSTFSTTSTTNVTSSAVVTLPSSQKDYEVQVRLTANDPAERATCTHARVVLSWA